MGCWEALCVLNEKTRKHYVFLFGSMHSMVGIKGCSSKNASICFPLNLLDGLSKKFVCVELINRIESLHEP